MGEPTSEAPEPRVPEPPERVSAAHGPSRSLARAVILVVLGYHVAMPLTYYLSDRVYDERFSWRMFSTVRLQECDVAITERVAGSERVVQAAQDLQIAWVNVLKRLRPAVIDKYFARRCDASGAEEVSLVGRCQNTDGAALPERRFVMSCAARRVREEGVP